MWFSCCTSVPVDVSGLAIRSPIGVANPATSRLNVAVVQQSGVKLSTFFDGLHVETIESEPTVHEVQPLNLSGPLPPEILNTFEKLSRNILPPSPKEDSGYVSSPEPEAEVEVEVEVETVAVQASVESSESTAQVSVDSADSTSQASVDVKDAITQTLVGENRLEVPRLR